MRKAFFVALICMFLIAGCGTIATPIPKVLPTVVLDSGTTVEGTPSSTNVSIPASANASGKVVPAQMATLASAVGGNIISFRVVEGDSVEAGQILVTLSGADQFTAAVSAAKLELLSAEQALKDLQNKNEVAKAAAQLRLANAKDALDQAEKNRASKAYRIGNENQIAIAKAELILAEDSLKKTEDIYGRIVHKDVENLNKAAALTAIANARKARDKAQVNLAYLQSLPDKFDLEIADAELAAARAEVTDAQAEFDKYQDGPPADVLGLAQARVDNARAQIEANQSRLNDLEIKAPFAGLVGKVNLHTGEYAAPGQPIMVLANMDGMQVETSDLSEQDVALVEVGQTVSIFVKALNETVSGKVIRISNIPDTLGGDVVYQTTISMDKIPEHLRIGMTVEVQYQ